MNTLFSPPSQPSEAASPPPGNKASPPETEGMRHVVARLAKLRETYLEELKAAREKVKKNFLK
jgi:hypothetical protein